MSSPTQRSLALLRGGGYHVGITEQWVPKAKIRRDLFGIFDLVAVHSGIPGVLGVQVCNVSDIYKRRVKIKMADVTPTWIAAGNRIEIHGWGKSKKWHEKRETYQVKILTVGVDDIPRPVDRPTKVDQERASAPPHGPGDEFRSHDYGVFKMRGCCMGRGS